MASNVRKCLAEFIRANGFTDRWLEEGGYSTSI